MNAQQQNSEAVEVMAPETREVTAGGKVYQVRRLETRQIWPILRCGLPIVEGLAVLAKPATDSPLGGDRKPGGQAPGVTAASALDSVLGLEAATFLRVFAEHGERVTEIIATALDEKISTVGRFEPQETFEVAKAIVQVNADFFSTRVAPLLGIKVEPGESGLASAIGVALGTSGAGETPSSS